MCRKFCSSVYQVLSNILKFNFDLGECLRAVHFYKHEQPLKVHEDY